MRMCMCIRMCMCMCMFHTHVTGAYLPNACYRCPRPKNEEQEKGARAMISFSRFVFLTVAVSVAVEIVPYPRGNCFEYCEDTPCHELNGGDLDYECGGCSKDAACNPRAIPETQAAGVTGYGSRFGNDDGDGYGTAAAAPPDAKQLGVNGLAKCRVVTAGFSGDEGARLAGYGYEKPEVEVEVDSERRLPEGGPRPLAAAQHGHMCELETYSHAEMSRAFQG